MKTLRILTITLLTLLLGGSSVQALDFSLGEVVVENLGDYGYTANNSRLSFDGGATDELYQMFGYVGNASDHSAINAANFSVDSAIAEVGGAGSGLASSTVTLNAAGAAALGLAAGAFSVTYDYELIDDTAATDVDYMAWDVTFTNNTAADIVLSFYAYLDFDLDGDFNDDEANVSAGAIYVNDSGASRPFWWTADGGADHFQIGGYPSVRTALNNMTSATDLSDTGGGFGPGDFTGAYQFDLTIAANDSVTVGMNLPNVGASWMLLMGLAGLAIAPRTLRRGRA